MQPWGATLEKLDHISSLPDTMNILDKSGRNLLDQQLHTQFRGFPNAYGNRGAIQRILYDHAKSLGVEISFGQPVSKIFETESSAGVMIGERTYEADFVIAADGVRGKTREYVTKKEDRPKKSGFAVYRSWFPLDALKGDPATEAIAKADKAFFKVWIAKDTHAILTTNLKMRAATCFVTHKVSVWHYMYFPIVFCLVVILIVVGHYGYSRRLECQG
jgi:2-polyprenyl-6-methoxyphenol hydroxylase-like FAD-dependent oxidoreductase